MSKFEKLSIILAAIALFISILSPVVTFFWFDTSQRDYDSRARFELVSVSGSCEPEECTSDYFGTVEFKVQNIGNRAAIEYHLVATHNDHESALAELVAFKPEGIVRTIINGRTVFHYPELPVPSGKYLDIIIRADIGGMESLLSLYLYTKEGDPIRLHYREIDYSSGGW